MKKISLLIGFLMIGNLSAQINTNAKLSVSARTSSFLDASKNTSNYGNNIGKGLNFPQTDLSTFTLNTRVLDGIEYPNYYDGMIVYNTNKGGTTSDQSLINQTQNLEPGFYYFSNPNGVKTKSIRNGQWVRLGGDKSFNELWSQKLNGAITETYLKPATESGDEYMYSPKRSYINLGNAQEIVGASGFKYLNAKKDVPNLLMINATALPTGDTALGQYGKRYIPFSREVYTIDENYRPEAGEIMKYFGRELTLQGKNLNTDIGYLIGHNIGVDFQSSSKTVQLVGGRFGASAGDINAETSPIISSKIIGVHSTPSVYSGKTKDLVGTYNELNTIGGIIDNLIGTENKVYTSTDNTSTNNKIFQDVLGTRSNVKITNNSIANRLYGHLSYTDFNATSTIKSEAAGIATSAYIKAGSTIKTFMGVRSYINAEAGANVTDMYGFRFQEDLKEGFAPENLYGLYIGAVKRGTQNNFSIYTNEGKIRFGDLASTSATGDRPVYVDVDGLLKVGESGATQLSGTEGITCNDTNRGKMNFFKSEDDNKSDVFGICMRNKDGNYYWAYMVGGNNPTNGTGTFGNGLQ